MLVIVLLGGYVIISGAYIVASGIYAVKFVLLVIPAVIAATWLRLAEIGGCLWQFLKRTFKRIGSLYP